MSILRSIESGDIGIKEMGIIKAVSVLLLSVALEVLGLIPVTILNLFNERFEVAAPYITFILGVLVKYFVIIILLKLFGSKIKEQKPKSYLNIKTFVYIALVIIAFRMIFDNSLAILIKDIPMPDVINEAFEELAVSPIILIITVAIIAPLYEEIIFRGIILKGMAKKLNPIVALIISALFFALVHFNIPQGINAFLLGIVIGAIYLNTDSIYLCIFAHFSNNIIAITASTMYAMIKGRYAIEAHGAFFILGIILLVIAFKGLKQNSIEKVRGVYSQFKEM